MNSKILSTWNFQKRYGRGGLIYWTAPDCPIDLNPEVLHRHKFNWGDQTAKDISVLKRDKRTSVARVDLGGQVVLFKCFRLKTLRDKRKYNRFALPEIINSLEARARGISAPACYGYFEIRPLWLGGISYCGALVEFIDNLMEMKEFYGSPEKCFPEIIPILVQLYQTGVNHCDISPRNVLINPQTRAQVIVDWQYCSFVAPGNDVQLILHMVKYLRYAQLSVREALVRNWIAALLQACDSAMSVDKFQLCVATLEGKKISLHERLSLKVERIASII